MIFANTQSKSPRQRHWLVKLQFPGPTTTCRQRQRCIHFDTPVEIPALNPSVLPSKAQYGGLSDILVDGLAHVSIEASHTQSPLHHSDPQLPVVHAVLGHDMQSADTGWQAAPDLSLTQMNGISYPTRSVSDHIIVIVLVLLSMLRITPS